LSQLEKIKESLQDGKTISFEEMHPNELAISSGKVKMYNEQRGFGFIEDDREGIDAFFHITRTFNTLYKNRDKVLILLG